MKKISLAGLIAGSLLAFSTAAQAETVLTASSFLPVSSVPTQVLTGWAQDVEKATDGRVKIKLLPKPVAAPASTIDAVRDGLADIAWGVNDLTPGRFVLTMIAELPGLGDSGEATSVAFHRTYEKFLIPADEYRGVKLLGVYTHGPGDIWNVQRPVKTVADMEGLKLRTAGGIMTDVAGALGAVPVAKPASEVPELITTGIVDGVLFPVNKDILRLVKYGTIVPGGLYCAVFSVFMNEDSFARLSKEDQDILMGLSGEALARRGGAGFDAQERMGFAYIEEHPEIQVITADEAFQKAVAEKTAGLEQNWIAAANAKGIDGAAALRYMREQIAEIQKK